MFSLSIIGLSFFFCFCRLLLAANPCCQKPSQGVNGATVGFLQCSLQKAYLSGDWRGLCAWVIRVRNVKIWYDLGVSYKMIYKF